MNEFDKSSTKDVSAVNKRRNFLKKSATGAVIVSLPAKSVWGTTCNVSGNLSGNLSTSTHEQTCTLPTLDNGCHPYKWKDLDNNCEDMFDRLKDMGHSYHSKDNDECQKEKDIYKDTINAVKGNSLKLPSKFFGQMSDDCDRLLSGAYGSDYEKLAAVYLNACFGFYPGYNGVSQAEDLCKEVFVYIYVNNKNGKSVSDYDLGFNNDAKSYWAP